MQNSSGRSKLSFFLIEIIVFSLCIILVSIIYAKYNTGRFTFSAHEYNYAAFGIEVSETMDFESPTSLLIANSMVDKNGVTYDTVDFDAIMQSEGQYVDPNKKYLAYSFFIKNKGTTSTSVDYTMRLTEVSNRMDQYVRVLVIEDDTYYSMYQKADQPDIDNNIPYDSQSPVGINFESDTIIFRDSIDEFEAEEVKLFRVIIWLDDNDSDLSDDFEIGHIKVKLSFSANYPEDLNSTKAHILLSDSEKLWFTLSTVCEIRFGVYYELDTDF